MKTLPTLLLVIAAASAGAQGTTAPAKPDSSKAPATKAPVTKPPATKTQAKPDSAKAPATKAAAPGAKTSDAKAAAPTNTKQDTKTAAASNTKAADTKTAAPNTKAADTKSAQGTRAPAPGTKAPGTNPGATTTPATPQLQTPTIMREVYTYDVEGRRDPFISLLSSSTLRPTVADLYLTSILYDENGSNSIALMRDPTDGNKQYRVTTGQTLGRMKVALIKRKVVIFSIEEFGTNRQDSLILGDTTKVRAK